MPTCACPDIEIRTGTLTVNNGSGDYDAGNVQLIEYGFLCEKHPIKNPVYNVTSCVKEYYNGLYIVVTLDCSKWESFDKWLGVTSNSIGAANPALPTGTDGMIGPVSIDETIYLDDPDQLGDEYRGPYAGLQFENDSACPGGGAILTEGTDYEFGDDDGSFIVNELDPFGVDGNYVYICAGTYTTTASERYQFDECAIDTSMSVKYEHPMQDACPADNTFTVYMPNAYIAECITITDSPDEIRQYQVRFESIWDDSAAGYELGYWDFETA